MGGPKSAVVGSRRFCRPDLEALGVRRHEGLGAVVAAGLYPEGGAQRALHLSRKDLVL